MSFTESSHLDAKNRIISQKKSWNMKSYRHVMCFGTFDIFHPGHEYYLSEASEHAETMTVVIARDHRVFSGKWRDPIHDEWTRKKSVESSFPKAHVILGHESDIFAPIREYMPDLLAFGYDQRVPEEKIHELFPSIEIIRIEGFETTKWKSSLLRSGLWHR